MITKYKYHIAGNFRGSKLSRIRPKIIFTELIFANFIIQPFCTVLFIILRILFSRISKNRKKSESYWPRKFPAIMVIDHNTETHTHTLNSYHTLCGSEGNQQLKQVLTDASCQQRYSSPQCLTFFQLPLLSQASSEGIVVVQCVCVWGGSSLFSFVHELWYTAKNLV